MPTDIPVIDRAALDLLCTGRFFLGPLAREVIRDISADALKRHPNYPRTCLSCGARESLDGSLPCGH
ncbi:hypothetical protein [Caballeronia sp. DA-9]|uniref:hypothetical protein n=1 Tax=Caballeronia sp. DA-9 TaxID=3436237 RepID=UPI003F66DFBE